MFFLKIVTLSLAMAHVHSTELAGVLPSPPQLPNIVLAFHQSLSVSSNLEQLLLGSQGVLSAHCSCQLALVNWTERLSEVIGDEKFTKYCTGIIAAAEDNTTVVPVSAGMTKQQVAGISFGIIVLVVLIIGVIATLCRRPCAVMSARVGRLMWNWHNVQIARQFSDCREIVPNQMHPVTEHCCNSATEGICNHAPSSHLLICGCLATTLSSKSDGTQLGEISKYISDMPSNMLATVDKCSMQRVCDDRESSEDGFIVPLCEIIETYKI